MPSYIPLKDSLCKDWLSNFASRITASPSTYGLTAGEATTIQNAYNAFASAYTIAIDPSTRTKSTVADKDAMKAAALAIVRPYAQLVRRNAGVDNQSKLDLGLTIVDTTKTPIPAPQTSPILSVIAATPLQFTLRYVDQNTPTKRAKPTGVIFLELMAQTSATAITDPATIAFKQLSTANPVAVNWQQADVGKTAYMAARWVTRRGLLGPWSNIVSFTVANS